MTPNPYQSPEEHGKTESNLPGRNWWKLACLMGLMVAGLSIGADIYVSTAWPEPILPFLAPEPPKIARMAEKALAPTFLSSLAVFVIGGIGWTRTSRTGPPRFGKAIALLFLILGMCLTVPVGFSLLLLWEGTASEDAPITAVVCAGLSLFSYHVFAWARRPPAR